MVAALSAAEMPAAVHKGGGVSKHCRLVKKGRRGRLLVDARITD